MSWTDPPVLYPHEVQDVAIDVLTDNLRHTLAAAERRLAVPAQTIEPFATIRPLVGQGADIRSDPLPCCLLGMFGTLGQPERSRDHTLSCDWQLAAQIVVAGVDREDTLQRRSVYSMVVAEALLQWMPRRDHIDAVTLDSIEYSSGRAELAGTENTIGEAQINFTVHVPLMLSVVAPFDPALTPGAPGGPPSTPYAVPAPLPVPDPSSTVTRF